MMRSLFLGGACLGLSAEPEVKLMKTTWMNYSYVTSGFNLCNENTDICRSLGHWVFTSASENIADGLIAGASFSVDGGPYVASKRGNFEAHFVNGQCSNTSDASSCIYYADKRQAQVWNIGYDVIQRGTASTLQLPQQVCAKAWTYVPATGEFGELEALCAAFETTTIKVAPEQASLVPDMMYSQSADCATYLCSGEYCRSDGHISLDVEVSDPTQELLGLVDMSIDGGNWSSANTNTFFEQKVKHQNGKWYHTLSWNYDEVLSKNTTPPKEVCVKMVVENLVTLTTWDVDFGGYASNGDKHQRCLKFCDFTTPFSHAVSAGGYCPHKSTQVSMLV